MGHRLRFRIPFGQFVDLLCQIRRCLTADGLPDISTRQPLHRSSGRLDPLLQRAAGAEPALSERLIIEVLVNLTGDITVGRRFSGVRLHPVGSGLVAVLLRRTGHLTIRGFCCLYLTLRPGNIPNLTACLTNQQRLFQPLLLLIKYLRQPRIRMLNATAQLGRDLFSGG